jgi:Big-like domain-containing protein/parallel beta helix pectate lyase-like protein
MSHTPLRPDDPRALVARWRRRARLPLAVLLAFAAVPAMAQAADLHATPANLTSVFASAQGGDVIHLAAGSYSQFNGGAKSGRVTLVPEPGASVSMSLGSSPSNITVSGMTIPGGTLRGAHDITIANSTFTDTLNIVSMVANANIVVDHDVFNNISPCGSCPEGRVTVTTDGSRPPGPSGVTISNSVFSGGNSDGVQITGNANGVVVGPGNEFFNLAQSSSVHTDSIQLYGASDTTITGNYIHDAAEGIMAPDGGDSGFLHIENNVFSRIDQQGVYLGFKPGLVLNHNTFSAGVMLHDDPTKGGSPTVGAIIKNNILLNGVAKQNLMANAIAVEDYNLLAGGSGAHDIKAGKPTFAAGAAPTTFAGWLLAPGSVGAKAADDGADMGILPAPVAAPAPAAAPATKTATMRRGGAPAISIKSPTAGSRFSRLLKVAATAKDNNGIDRVGFWLDNHWVGTDRTAPYALRTRVPKGTRFRSHTLTVRAFSPDGQISSLSVTLKRVRHIAHSARASRSAAWRLSAKPSKRGTALRGSGTPRHRVKVYLARCTDPSGRIAKRMKLRTGANGKLSKSSGTTNLCVVRLQPV